MHTFSTWHTGTRPSRNWVGVRGRPNKKSMGNTSKQGAPALSLRSPYPWASEEPKETATIWPPAVNQVQHESLVRRQRRRLF